ncbi:MAG: hypothetical protein ACI83W_002340 [Marinoscillum sp.]|jgi:hypothetical protein
MKRLLLLIFSILAWFTGISQAKDSINIDSVATNAKVRFVQPSIVVDYGKIIYSLASNEDRYEAGLHLLFLDHYYLVGEYGIGNLAPENAIENGHYKSEGSYFRFGGGYLATISGTSKLGLGARYSVCQFQDEGTVLIQSPSEIQPDYERTFSRNNLEARWLELVLASESKLKLNKANPESGINQLFAIGFQLRLRLLSTYDRFTPYDVYAIPGYGRTVSNPALALNLIVKINLTK